ncbi:hypothetical protein chiPu_0023538, partial [Chiloscyllium punctatum]|nr:hypothetical protein [Chiloscyllium punctatum]
MTVDCPRWVTLDGSATITEEEEEEEEDGGGGPPYVMTECPGVTPSGPRKGRRGRWWRDDGSLWLEAVLPSGQREVSREEGSAVGDT